MMIVFPYKLMKVVSEELCTLAASMAIVNTEKRTLRPTCHLSLLALWFHNVKNDGDSIFIIVSNGLMIFKCLPNDALVGVCTVG